MQKQGYRPIQFFLITLGFSWLFWIPAAFVPANVMETPWQILLYLGGLGPALGGILLSHSGADKFTRRDYWSRVLSLKRISGIWFGLILLFYPLLTILVILLVEGQLQLNIAFSDLLSNPLRLIPFLLFLYIFGPFPEELGWRGYGLDALQSRLNPAISSLILGLIWGLWHIPLFLMNGTYQHQLGLGSADFWIFLIAAALISFFFTWIYNHNQRSILAASVFHFSVNLTGNIFYETEEVRLARLILLLVLAGILIFAKRPFGELGRPAVLTEGYESLVVFPEE